MLEFPRMLNPMWMDIIDQEKWMHRRSEYFHVLFQIEMLLIPRMIFNNTWSWCLCAQSILISEKVNDELCFMKVETLFG